VNFETRQELNELWTTNAFGGLRDFIFDDIDEELSALLKHWDLLWSTDIELDDLRQFFFEKLRDRVGFERGCAVDTIDAEVADYGLGYLLDSSTSACLSAFDGFTGESVEDAVTGALAKTGKGWLGNMFVHGGAYTVGAYVVSFVCRELWPDWYPEPITLAGWRG